MKRSVFFALSLVVALGACKAEPTTTEKTSASTTATVGKLTDLSVSLDAARAEFNAKTQKPRFLTLLSPTCGACVHGAHAVKLAIVDNPRTRSIVPMVVWIPMLDDDSLGAANEASMRFRDLPIPQFWDSRQRFGKEVARSVGVADWTAWDIYLFYPPGARWTDAGLPTPEAALAQVGGVVVGTKGTLQPLADQARLPKDMNGKAEVVGEQHNLEALLTQAAEAFAKRQAKGP